MAIPQIPQTTVLSYKLFVRAQDSQMVPIGQVQTLDISESRDVTPNFVIGNDPRDEASHLIPGVVRTRQIRLKRVRLFAKSLRKAFGRKHETTAAAYFGGRDFANRLPFDPICVSEGAGGAVDLDRFFAGGSLQHSYSESPS